MNKLKGHIAKIKTSGNLSRVDVALSEDIVVSAVVIETPDTAAYLKKNNEVYVLFKETEVILSADPEVEISLVNRIPGKISNLLVGDLFCEVSIQTEVGEIRSVISKIAWERWPMAVKDPVTALVKINEIMLQE
ncbi:TOBE domain-containing protein [Lentiprolixibacter aurantiacus]|uniref:Tobe domain protein n=1 Tax=Lentiprolixibacter aurantiacus TaxID=2993939 RepID=A0AAE3MLH9_9FLAO|nr:TOBE domain-containing protein [Lentiprolixibacter aurantiacus]MCX2720025.1 tobe domain protein [Lentiprolixibacter aurantiacus]